LASRTSKVFAARSPYSKRSLPVEGSHPPSINSAMARKTAPVIGHSGSDFMIVIVQIFFDTPHSDLHQVRSFVTSLAYRNAAGRMPEAA
jgi:hypothetical protein